MAVRREITSDWNADYDEHAVVSTGAEREAAGVKAVMVSLKRGLEPMGVVRTGASLIRLNQRNGFDCPGCAWPEEHGGRKFARVLRERRQGRRRGGHARVVTPEFFARHSVAELWPPSPSTGWPAGPAHPTDGAPPGATHYAADRMG